MYQNSKIEARIESVRLAILLKDVTIENVLSVSKQIEEYITEGIELPNIYDPNSYIKDLAGSIANATKGGEKTESVDANLIKELADA